MLWSKKHSLTTFVKRIAWRNNLQDVSMLRLEEAAINRSPGKEAVTDNCSNS